MFGCQQTDDQIGELSFGVVLQHCLHPLHQVPIVTLVLADDPRKQNLDLFRILKVHLTL